MAKRLRGEDSGLNYICMLGLISSPERLVARAALEDALAVAQLVSVFDQPPLALATGQSWLLDKSALQRLSQLTKVRRIQQVLDGYLKIWENDPLTISLEDRSPSGGFHARIAQYEFRSLDALKKKLAQFPSGTKFLLSNSQVESPANDQTLIELRTFLSSPRPRVP